MQFFTGFEYLLIDAANNFGLDKLPFEERIEWATENLDNLEALAEEKGFWKTRPLYLKATQAIRKAQQGKPTGHLVGFDAVCSGMQLMSVLTGCKAGAEATGLINPNKRADAYSECTVLMNKILGIPSHQEGAPRADVKQAVMTSLYGSKKEPKLIFGEGTKELAAFHEAMFQLAPGACQLLAVLLESWDPFALYQAWKLPDGYDAKVKVMQRVEKRIEVDELDHATFTHTFFVNEGEEKGVKNAANVVHSVDAYVLRSLVRRCNYDEDVFRAANNLITAELLERAFGKEPANHNPDTMFGYYHEQYAHTEMPDVIIVPHLTEDNVGALETRHLRQLNHIIASMLRHKPFAVVTVHDDFRAHPNNINWLRVHYKNILAELSNSNVLNDLLSQLFKREGAFPMLSTDLADSIRQSSYALC